MSFSNTAIILCYGSSLLCRIVRSFSLHITQLYLHYLSLFVHFEYCQVRDITKITCWLSMATLTNKPAFKHPQIQPSCPKPANWEPNRSYSSLFEHGHPLFQLNGLYVAHSSTHDSYHEIVKLLNNSDSTVYFDWGEGWLKGGPPYFVHYLGDYEKAKQAYLSCSSNINTILQKEIEVTNATRFGDTKVNFDALDENSLEKADMYTIGQTWM